MSRCTSPTSTVARAAPTRRSASRCGPPATSRLPSTPRGSGSRMRSRWRRTRRCGRSTTRSAGSATAGGISADPRLEPARTAGHSGAAMIRVASYNMRKAIGTDRRRRPERTLDVLNELDADLVALQEADRRFGSRLSAVPLRMIEEHSDYKPVPLDTRAGSIGWHGNALLVRKNVEVLEGHMLHLPSLEPRGAVCADLR